MSKRARPGVILKNPIYIVFPCLVVEGAENISAVARFREGDTDPLEVNGKEGVYTDRELPCAFRYALSGAGLTDRQLKLARTPAAHSDAEIAFYFAPPGWACENPFNRNLPPKWLENESSTQGLVRQTSYNPVYLRRDQERYLHIGGDGDYMALQIDDLSEDQMAYVRRLPDGETFFNGDGFFVEAINVDVSLATGIELARSWFQDYDNSKHDNYVNAKRYGLEPPRSE